MGRHLLRLLLLLLLGGCTFDRAGIAIEPSVDVWLDDTARADTRADTLRDASDAEVLDRSVTADSGPDGLDLLPPADLPPADLPPADLPPADLPPVGFQPSNLAAGASLPALCATLSFAADGSVDTTLCEVAGVGCTGAALSQSTSGAPAVCVIRTAGLSLAKGVTVKVKGDKPLLLLVEGDASIGGTLDAAGALDAPGPGGGAGGGLNKTSKGYEPVAGAGPGGGGTCSCDAADKDDCAGGGGGYGTAGADGGVEDEGSGGCSPPPQGGSAYGDPTLVPLQGGSGGASGRNTEGTLGKPGKGGGGGGALQVSVQGDLTVDGAINAGGGGGGHANDDQQVFAGGAGGGGSGGAVLLEALRILGTGWIAVNGGGGGGGGTAGAAGLDGEGGLPDDSAAKGGKGQQAGEDGGAGAAGSSAPVVGGSGYDSPGGGGGGLGRIRLNWCQSCAGASAPTPSSSGVASQGAVAP